MAVYKLRMVRSLGCSEVWWGNLTGSDVTVSGVIKV